MNELVYLKDIAGYDEEKEEAKKIIEVLKNHKKYEDLGAYIPKGLILSGNPGVGKTLLAKAIANESGVPLFEFETNESETEAATIKSIKDVFTKAKENAPSIVFIDELDELVMTEDFRSDYSRKIAKILLTELDGITSSKGILVIATTNYRAALPPALMRSGRMDKRITVDMPDSYSREAIFKYYLDKHESLSDIDSKTLAIKTSNFSGADIKTLINETIIDCASKKIEKITLEDFERNIPVVMFQDIKKNNKNGPDDSTCYHEIGHFITEYVLSGKIGSISTERYGRVRGHVMFDFEEIEPLEKITKNTIEDKLVTLLGGMAAEEVLYNDITSGSSVDVGTARRYIQSLMSVGAYGFDKLLPNSQVGRMSSMSFPISEERTKSIEELETTLLDNAYKRAKEIIGENVDFAKYLYSELKIKEKLSQRELKDLVESYNKKR